MRTFIRFTLLSVLISASITPRSACLAQGTAFTYQGRLNEGSGAASGLYDFRFVLYDASPGGNQTGPILTNPAVAVAGGLFTTSLDFGASFPGADRWLEIAVRTNGSGLFATLSPRQKIAPTPYAIAASNLTGTLQATQLAGVLPSANLGGTYSGGVTLNNAANSFTGNGAGLTALNASQLSSGTVPDARLAVNVARTNQVWLLNGNAGTTPGSQFLGTMDNQPLEFRVNGQRAWRVEPTTNHAPNLIGGAVVNYVSPWVTGAVIAGGGGEADYHGGVYSNLVAGDFGVIGGGYDNRNFAPNAVLGGGVGNQIAMNSEWSIIGGGNKNNISWDTAGALIAGGQGNYIGQTTPGATIGGGWSNLSLGILSTISGGEANLIWSGANHSVIAAGFQNMASGAYSAIGGGVNNTNLSEYATIPGGRENVATNYAFAAGRRAKALHTGTFVWADSTDASFVSTSSNQFLLRATNGVGINKNNPTTALDVNGTVKATGFSGNGAGLTALPAANLSGTIPSGSLADNSVTAAKLASDAGSLGKVSAGAMTSSGGNIGIGTAAPYDALLDVEGDLRLNMHELYLREGSDRNHGLGWYGAGKLFAGVNIDGPVAYGWSGGGLGATSSTNLALRWTGDGNVAVDPLGQNPGNLVPGLTFGASSGEGISSKRSAGGNQYGLDFYTSFQPRMSITQSGNVGIGTGTPTAQLDVTGDTRVQGLLRTGSETGTSEAPNPSEGIIIRRINSSSTATNQIVARTEALELRRDGSSGGWVIRYRGFPNAGNYTLAFVGTDTANTMHVSSRTVLEGTPAVNLRLWNDADNILYFHGSFGSTASGRHMTEVTLTRLSGDAVWVGTVTSTFNQ